MGYSRLFTIIQEPKIAPLQFLTLFCPVKLWQTISIEMKHLQKIFQSFLRSTAILCTKYSRLHLGTSCWKDPNRRMVMERKFNSPLSFTEPRYWMWLTLTARALCKSILWRTFGFSYSLEGSKLREKSRLKKKKIQIYYYTEAGLKEAMAA